MSSGTLRLRLVAAAALAIFLAVSVLGVTVALLVGRQLRSSLDAGLHARAVDVARLAVSAPALLTAPGALDAPQGGRELAVEVVDRHGRIVARSAALGGRLLPAGTLLARAIAQGTAGYRDGQLSQERVRVHAVPVADAGGPAGGGAVLVSSQVGDIEQTLGRIRGLIAVSAVLAALLGAAVAAALTARGLAPLRRLAEAAGAIARTGDGTRRLPVPTTGDELSGLADTLNTMLAGLERSQRAERRFLADASHELRTPLTSLRGNVAYLIRHGPDAETLADLEADAARLARLVDDLLRLEREGATAAPVEALALADLAGELAQRHGAQTTVLEPATVRGEPGALERAVENLLENARIHGPRDGVVTVEQRLTPGGVALSVSDQGPGPPEAERERAFDRFWRGAEAGGRPGSGLGLALVRAVVKRHGGRVWVTGSRFTIELPIVRESSQSVASLGDNLEKGPSRP